MPGYKPDERRFWDHVMMGAPSACWTWTGSTIRGYGTMTQGRYVDGTRRAVLAHRFAYERANGPIPDGLVLDHLCRNPGCVNPSHLEAVPQRDNVRRGFWGTRTHCKNGHEYTPENTTEYRGARRCAECNRRWCREKYARRHSRASDL